MGESKSSGKAIHCHTWGQFYMRWLGTAFRHSWSITDTSASVLGLFVPPAIRLLPRVESALTPLVWEIPLCALGALALSRLVAAPYWIYKERHIDAGREADEYRRTIESKDEEIEELRAVPPEIKLTIENVVMHRTGDQELRWKNGEFLVQASAELLNLPSATVEYSAQLVFRGEVIELATIRDIDRWEIIERKYFQQMYPNTPSMCRPRQDFVTNPAAITDNLTRSIRNEGWLHFQIEGMGESDIAKRTLRVYARSVNGSTYRDQELAQHHVVRSDLVAMRKYFPTPQ